MERLVLNKIKTGSNKVLYSFHVSTGLKSFFTDRQFIIEYCINDMPLDISSVPNAVLAIPFVCNVLPIIWLADAELVIPELDEDFFISIPAFKQGYIDMYMDATFKGKVTVDTIENNIITRSNRSATFFSGGLDAWCTLARHFKEQPDIISIWGADIKVDNLDGWVVLYSNLKESAKDLGLPIITIKSTFREVVNESALSRTFYPVLHDGWWHGAQHGIGLIGHSAPSNYLRGVTTQYIAASFSPEDGKLTCASWPTIDNNVRFAGCRVIHDAFITRQKKIRIIKDFCEASGKKVILHVCWRTSTGRNCCKCEKCCRTIIGLLVEGAKPEEYGFSGELIDYKYIADYIRYDVVHDQVSKAYWKQIQAAYRENRSFLDRKIVEKIGWINNVDFDNLNHFRRKWYQIKKAKSIRGKLGEFSFYQFLHKVKYQFYNKNR